MQVFPIEADFLSNLLTLCFLITDILKYVIVHIVHCISVRCWIAVYEMFVPQGHS
jgi:hypothetical protein